MCLMVVADSTVQIGFGVTQWMRTTALQSHHWSLNNFQLHCELISAWNLLDRTKIRRRLCKQILPSSACVAHFESFCSPEPSHTIIVVCVYMGICVEVLRSSPWVHHTKPISTMVAVCRIGTSKTCQLILQPHESNKIRLLLLLLLWQNNTTRAESFIQRTNRVQENK